MQEGSAKLTRRALFNQIIHQQPIIRPPWALAESLFVQTCQRCDACIQACEYELLFRGSGGYPEIRFDKGGCDFCGDCLKACPHQALKAPVPAPSLAWPHRARIIESRCLSLQGVICRSCGESCDAEAIQFELQLGGKAKPLLDAERCNGCGECLSTCPHQAIQLGQYHE